MMWPRSCLVFAVLAVLMRVVPSVTMAAVARISHTVHVTLDPGAHHIAVRDALKLPASFIMRSPQGIMFLLHAGLTPRVVSGPYTLELLPGIPAPNRSGTSQATVPLSAYRLRPQAGIWPAQVTPVIRYSGTLHHPLPSAGSAYAQATSPGLLSADGVVLSGSSWWLPSFGSYALTFDMTVALPAGWDAVSQGRRTRHETQNGRRLVRWENTDPTEDIYLIAAPFTAYTQQAGEVRTYAFLRQPDPPLAARYLEATARYLTMYTRLLGPYPYPKFALVENVWETGYGMPSFTLLGSKILRFPFILHSSYPHEILHNWWGNGVFVDYEQGNWSEGLTAYLADHLLKEARGQGTAYRRETLQRYRNYVNEARDFPLRAFRARHSSATQAVGYGKSLMLWHMLRLELGDAVFVRGLRRLFQTYRLQRASFADIAHVFSTVSGRDLTAFFTQWVERTGAPQLTLHVTPTDDGHGRIIVEQAQAEMPYTLTVPVALTYTGQGQAQHRRLALAQRRGVIDIAAFGTLRRVDVDPQFDLFRRLDRQEIPPTVSQLFGANQVTVVLPFGEQDGISAAAWQDFAARWRRGNASVELVREDELTALPTHRAVWVLGASNRWRTSFVTELAAYGAGIHRDRITFGSTAVPQADHCFVFVTRHPNNPDLAIGWIGADRPEALPGLARKLPHYGKYSYLAFSGAAPTNAVKGQWPALGSPLIWTAPGAAHAPAGTLPSRQPLARPVDAE